jgi:hypothetical protein
MDLPLLVFGLSFAVLWFSANLGTFFGRKGRGLEEGEREDFQIVQAAILTLLGLLIGFTFSMAISRYDQRNNDEEAEANAISTEYVRADLLPAGDAARVHDLLRNYLDQRIMFYKAHNERQVGQINASTDRLQTDLWSTIEARAAVSPTPTVALVVSGMNDVVTWRGYTQSAWSNRIPVVAWGLMAAIAVCCNLMIGYGARQRGRFLFLVLPLAVSISFYLIADMDSLRHGLINVEPQNLESLSQSLGAH